MRNVNHETLEDFVKELLQLSGLNEKESSITAHHVVYANLRGVDSHGVQRIPIYVERISKGGITKNIEITPERETGISALIDGQGGIGQYVGHEALKIAIDKAKKNSIGIVGVNNTNHTGMLAYYSELAVKEDLIAFVTSNGEALVAPTGGAEKYLCVNPISFAFPTNKELPFILDMATGVAARGKVIAALNNNEEIPLGWAVDKAGNPTTNPAEALKGLLLPMAGAKGYGLAFMADIFSSVLTGANWGPHVNSLYDKPETPQGNGQFFFVMRADMFMDLEDFKNRLDQVIKEIHEVKKADGVERIYIPGEIEHEKLENRKKNGIPLPDDVIKELNQAGKSVGIGREL